jgi:hypothetical protein
MALKRENVGDHKVLYIRTTCDEEFDAFDQLGPMLRTALCDSPIKSSSVAIVQQIQEKNEQIRIENDRRRVYGMPPARLLDPKDPQLDAYLARAFLAMNAQNLMKDRSEEDAMLGIKPIRAQVSVKSIREQRRSLRARRW